MSRVLLLSIVAVALSGVTKSAIAPSDPCAAEQAAFTDAEEAVTQATLDVIDAAANLEAAEDAWETCDFNTPGQCSSEESDYDAAEMALDVAIAAADAAAEAYTDAGENLDACRGGGGGGEGEELEEYSGSVAEAELFAPPTT